MSIADGSKNGQKINQVGGNTPNVPKPPANVGGNTPNVPKPGKQTTTGGNYIKGQKVP